MMAKAKQKLDVLPLWKMIFYASGNFAKAMQMGIVDIFYMYFLITSVGLSAAQAGIVIFCGLVLYGISDIFISNWVDKYLHKFSSYASILFIVAPVNLVFFNLLFVLPIIWDSSPFLSAIISSFLFRLGYSLVDIPHNALLANIAKDKKIGATVSAWRFLFSSLSIFVIAGLSTVFENIGIPKVVDYSRYIYILLSVNFIYLVIICASAYASAALVNQCHATNIESIPLKNRLMLLTKNTQYLKVIAIGGLIGCFTPMAERAIVFISDFSESTDLSSWKILLFLGFGKVFSLFFWVRLSVLYGFTRVFQSAFVLSILSVFALMIYPWFPLSSLFVMYLLLGCALGGIATFIWASLAEAVNADKRLNTTKTQALYFGAFLMALKVSSGVGSLIFSLLLQAISTYSNQSALICLLAFVFVCVFGASALSIFILRPATDTSLIEQR